MKRLYSGALILFLFGSIFIQERVNGYQIYKSALSLVSQKYVPGEFVVKFKANVTEAEIADLNSNHSVATITPEPVEMSQAGSISMPPYRVLYKCH